MSKRRKRPTPARARSGGGTGGVSAQRLGSSLLELVEECLKVGDLWDWEPEPGSTAAVQWTTAAEDPLARTVCEADGHGLLLLRSGLEHAVVVSQSISAGRAFAPLTVARTAAEHALRAHYLLDPDVEDLERAGRRLNEWLHAVEEGARRRAGIVKAGHPGSETLKDSSDQLTFIDARAAALGLTLDGKGSKRHVVEVERRPGPMDLGERYLSDAEAFGVTTAAFRTKNAFMHGLEIGLLAATTSVPSSYDAHLMQPKQMAVGELAFATMSVPLAVFNATRAMARRFGRVREGDPAWTKVLKLRDDLVQTWAAPISADLDEIAPDRPQTASSGRWNTSACGAPQSRVLPVRASFWAEVTRRLNAPCSPRRRTAPTR